MICPICCRFPIGDYTPFLAGHHANCPCVYGLHELVQRIRAVVHKRHLIGAFTTYSNSTIGIRGTFSADDLRALADALEGKTSGLDGRPTITKGGKR